MMSYLLPKVRREDVGDGLVRVEQGGDGGAALHGGEVVDLVRVVHPRVGPRRGGGGGHGAWISDGSPSLAARAGRSN
jgi:hypothetical protein